MMRASMRGSTQLGVYKSRLYSPQPLGLISHQPSLPQFLTFPIHPSIHPYSHLAPSPPNRPPPKPPPSRNPITPRPISIPSNTPSGVGNTVVGNQERQVRPKAKEKNLKLKLTVRPTSPEEFSLSCDGVRNGDDSSLGGARACGWTGWADSGWWLG